MTQKHHVPQDTAADLTKLQDIAAKKEQEVKKTGGPAEPVTSYYGTGEYAVTSKNIDRLVEKLDAFNKDITKWQWALVDVLGIKKDRQHTGRFEKVYAALNEHDEKQSKLKKLMAEAQVPESKDPSKADV